MVFNIFLAQIRPKLYDPHPSTVLKSKIWMEEGTDLNSSPPQLFLLFMPLWWLSCVCGASNCRKCAESSCQMYGYPRVIRGYCSDSLTPRIDVTDWGSDWKKKFYETPIHTKGSDWSCQSEPNPCKCPAFSKKWPRKRVRGHNAAVYTNI